MKDRSSGYEAFLKAMQRPEQTSMCEYYLLAAAGILVIMLIFGQLCF